MAYNTDIERLNYYEGEYLGAVDFEAEQEYHRDMRRRHNIGQHTWGIVAGLDLAQIPNGVQSASGQAEVDVYIMPGVAIDGFGRELVALSQTQLTNELFAAFYNPNAGANPQYMYIWIAYQQQFLQPSQDACASQNTPNAFGRVQETFSITVTPNSTSPPDDPLVVAGNTMAPPPEPTSSTTTAPPPTPGQIVLPYDGSVPYQEFPTDDSTVTWFIPLGRVMWDPHNEVFLQIDPSSAASGRLYAGNVSSSVYAPTGSLTVRDRFAPYPLSTNQKDAYYNGVSVEVVGTLTVDRLLTALQDLWIYEAGHLYFKDDNGSDGDTPLWIQRVTNPTGGADLHIHIGDNSDPKNKPQRLTIGFGPADGSSEQNVLDVGADGNVNILVGALSFGSQNFQMGVQPGTLFFRSASDFAWYMGGAYSPNQDDPGTNGVLSMKLDSSGDLSVNAAVVVDLAGANTGAITPGLTFGTSGSEGVASNRQGNTNKSGLDLYTASTARISITNQGQVGIGTRSPSLPLDIQGDFGRQNGPATLHLWASQVADTGNGILSLRSGGSVIAFDGNDKVGIGTTTPALTLDIQGDFGRQNGAATLHLFGSQIADTGNGVLSLKSGGSVIAFDGNDKIGIGTTTPALTLDIQGDFGRQNGAATLHLFGSQIADTGNGVLSLQSGGSVVAFDGNDSVGIGTSTPTAVLDVVGDVLANSFSSSSDERFKTNIIQLTGVVEKLSQIRGLSFEWSEAYARSGKSSGKRQIGVLAQEVESVFPELVTTYGDQGFKALDYGRLSAVLIEAVKEIAAQNDGLRKRIDAFQKAKDAPTKPAQKPPPKKA